MVCSSGAVRRVGEGGCVNHVVAGLARLVLAQVATLVTTSYLGPGWWLIRKS
jgi:hypothetical protein